MNRRDFTFFHELRVRWAEVDPQNIVFNGHYLTYFDVGFTEYWRATGLPDAMAQQADGKEIFARKTTIEYHAPARFDEVLSIGVRCVGFGRSSVRFHIGIWRGGDFLIAGELNYVYADTTVRKGVPFPDAWRAVIRGLERTAPVDL